MFFRHINVTSKLNSLSESNNLRKARSTKNLNTFIVNNYMNFFLLSCLFLIFAGNLTVIADEEKTTFIPDANSKEVKPHPAKPIPFPKVLTPEKTLELFLLLPEKVLPLSKASRKLALEDEEITHVTEGEQTTVKWLSSPFKNNATEMKCIRYTTNHEPIFEVVYKWNNPGMIIKSHSYTYHLTRKSNGWLIKRIK
jgi:hypothetical protein